MRLTIHAEICCELCNSVIHNHLECPCCGDSYAATSAYCDLFEEDVGYEIHCECGAGFRLVSKEGWREEWEWEQILGEKNGPGNGKSSGDC